MDLLTISCCFESYALDVYQYFIGRENILAYYANWSFLDVKNYAILDVDDFTTVERLRKVVA